MANKNKKQKQNTALHLLEDVLEFERKFSVSFRDLQRGTLSHFPCLRECKQTHSDVSINLEYLQSAIIAMQSLFGRRFCEFRKEKTLSFPVSPFRHSRQRHVDIKVWTLHSLP